MAHDVVNGEFCIGKLGDKSRFDPVGVLGPPRRHVCEWAHLARQLPQLFIEFDEDVLAKSRTDPAAIEKFPTRPRADQQRDKAAPFTGRGPTANGMCQSRIGDALGGYFKRSPSLHGRKPGEPDRRSAVR